ncbi:MAG: hypothetical protein IJ915_00255 [Paludibacteraceae bacterium]|nr:hypothetical protein [Paludibacteraceae bacterium]
MVVFRAGMSGVDEDLHRFYRVLFCTEQFAIVIAGMGVFIGMEPLPLTECLTCLREGGAVALIDAVHTSLRTQAVRLRNDRLRLPHRPRRASSKNTH